MGSGIVALALCRLFIFPAVSAMFGIRVEPNLGQSNTLLPVTVNGRCRIEAENRNSRSQIVSTEICYGGMLLEIFFGFFKIISTLQNRKPRLNRSQTR